MADVARKPHRAMVKSQVGNAVRRYFSTLSVDGHLQYLHLSVTGRTDSALDRSSKEIESAYPACSGRGSKACRIRQPK